ncbi:adenylyl cyclase-associated protein 1 isoform X2 [Neocloeon triangulifer]|uniref:adenylyl cyclase-associated protein 1 isoform X2 n=1 Tax=Neocloeon triangulifer TaxID=2078957 RepID=UPI00286F3A84|nr:adenylyl cyclase-associated protein 1 isoform X2 [Neocloeon triangulifer]XP_059482080.1 adenylyl cyclase-associated protein 1 isoform X2 [Neocloeon triangulifer]
MADVLEALVGRLEAVATRLESLLPPGTVAPSAPAAPASGIVAMSASLQAFDDILQGPLATYLAASTKIGGDVATHADVVRQAFAVQRSYLEMASTSAAPAAAQLQNFLQPTSQKIQEIQQFREKNRASKLFNHLSAISESIPALGWVAVSPTPGPYVKEMNDAGQFYTNRVLKEWKEKDKVHVDWVQGWVQTLTELQKFIKQHHTTGLVWAGKQQATAGAPPPPPPGCPPPPPVLDMSQLNVSNGDDPNDRSALFAEINKGEGITSGLKKVTSDMQTHKNPNLRSGPAPFKAPASNASPAAKVTPIAKPPNMAKEGKKWVVEYFKGRKDLVIDQVEMNNVVYIFKCEDCVVTIKGKLNSVVMDSCKKSAIVVDSLVASAEFVNCQSVQMQVLGTVPTVSVDKTDGCQMYLNEQSHHVEIVSSKSSEMNILLPDQSGEFVEYAVPEQFKTTINKGGKGISTVAVESLG